MKRHGGTLNACYKVKETNLERLHTVRFQLYDILEKAELWNSKKVSGYSGLVGDRDEQVEHRGFSGQGNCSNTIMMDTCHYTFVQIHRMYNTKTEP